MPTREEARAKLSRVFDMIAEEFLEALERRRSSCRCSRAGRQRSRATGLRSAPMSLISTPTTSPSFMFSGSPSVPIHSASPGHRVEGAPGDRDDGVPLGEQRLDLVTGVTEE